MSKKILILIIALYCLTLFQTSFFVHFSIFGVIPNFVLIAVILWNFFEQPKSNLGIYSALIGGFFLDVFSGRPIGFYILIFIKFILKKHVRIPIIERA